jgi:hypothetical protein
MYKCSAVSDHSTGEN